MSQNTQQNMRCFIESDRISQKPYCFLYCELMFDNSLLGQHSALFNRFDENQDGDIDSEEFKAVCGTL